MAPTFEPAWPVDKLIPAGDNPRKDLGDLTELAESMGTVGVVEPLVATTTEHTAETGELLLIAGHRRQAAAVKAGLAGVPVMCHEGLDDATRLELMLVENSHRADLTPLEEAHTYDALVRLGVKQRDLAKKVSRSQPHVSRRLALLKLPETAQEAVDTGGIRIEDAVKLAALPAPDVAKLFKKGMPAEWEIGSAVRRYEQQQALAAGKAKAEKEGLRVVDPGFCGWNQPGDYLSSLTWVDGDAHRAEPCHAVYIGHDGELVPVCTDASRHPEPELAAGEDDEAGAESKERTRARRTTTGSDFESRRAEREQERLAAELAKLPRLDAIRRLLAGAPDGGFLPRVLALWPPSDGLAFQEAAVLLELTYETPDHDWDQVAARGAFLAELEENPARAAYALGLAHAESAVPDTGDLEPDSEYDREQLAVVRLYLGLLAGDGDYHPTERELVWMGEASTAPVGEEEPADQVDAHIAKRGKKWFVVCRTCDEELPGNTTEPYAQEALAAHLEVVHGRVPAEVSA